MPVCVISQPRFFPGLHYLHRMLAADIFVIFDTVQFSPRHEENRAKLKGPRGAQWLTVPMRQSHREQLVRDTHIDNAQPWQRQVMATVSTLYSKAPCYKAYGPEIMHILEAPRETLLQLDEASWAPALRRLGVTCRFVRASELPVAGRGPGLLLDICTHLGCETYLSGAFGREYLDLAAFAARGVTVTFHEYTYPVYPQRFGDFVPWLSYLDLLFNAGLDPDLVRTGGTPLSAARPVLSGPLPAGTRGEP